MKLIKIAATAAPAILAMMMASASWAAPCDDVGTYKCVFGKVTKEAAPNGGKKYSVQEKFGDPVEFCIQYSVATLPGTMAALLDVIGKMDQLADGGAHAILYTGRTSSCSGLGFVPDGPIR